MSRKFLLSLVLSTTCICAGATALPHPILFVTQVPTGYDYVNIAGARKARIRPDIQRPSKNKPAA